MMDSTPFLAPQALMRRHGVSAKKAWGQNFLHDPRVASRIVDAADIRPDETVVEIGAGLGALTSILAERTGHLVAIERDRELVTILRQELGHLPQVEVCEANALTFDFGRFGGPVNVVGNLPYHISTPLLFHLLEARSHLRLATLMLQREVAQRLASPPGSRVYGAPSVPVQQQAEVRLCFDVGRGAFLPAPNVDSSIVQLALYQTPRFPVDPEALGRVVRAAFAGRRKTLRRTLAAHYPPGDVERALIAAGIDGQLRAEMLGIEAFARLAGELERGVLGMPPAPGPRTRRGDHR